MQIAAAFTNIIEENNLTLVGVQVIKRQDGVTQWTGCVQWDGFARSGIACSHGHGPTPETAIEEAIAQSRIDRTPLADCSIPTLKTAA